MGIETQDKIEQDSEKENLTGLEKQTLLYAKNSGLEEYIEKISKNYERDTFEEKSSIPISPNSFENSDVEINIDSNNPEQDDSGKKFSIEETLKIYLELINSELENEAVEYPFLITGKTAENNSINLKHIQLLYDNPKNLKQTEVQPDSKILGKSIAEDIKQGNDIFVLSHTHPKIKDEVKKESLTDKISDEIKEKYNIKEVGLNFSLQDLFQLVVFEENLKKHFGEKLKAYISILMFNKDMYMVHIEDGTFKVKQIFKNLL